MDKKFWRDRRVLVTGHTGFKGSWLTRWLVHLGAKVTGYALAPQTNPSLFRDATLDREIRSIVADIRDLGSLERALKESDPEVVLHLAAQPLVRESYAQPLATFDINVMGTANLLECARHCRNLMAVTIITTDKVYENQEWHWGYRESESLGGHDPYSASKACAEIVASSYRRSFFQAGARAQIPIATVRAGNVVGGGDWSADRLVPDIIRAWWSKTDLVIRHPDSIRPWQHVLEPLGAYLHLTARMATEGCRLGEAWNIGPEDQDCVPVRTILTHAHSSLGENLRITTPPSTGPHEAHYLKLDCSKAKAKLGWRPQLQLSEGLQWTFDWYRAYTEGASALALMDTQISEYQNRLCNDHAP